MTISQAISSTAIVRKLSKKLMKPDQLADLLEQRPRRLEAGAGEPAGLQQIVGGDRAAAGGEPEPGERAEDDVGEGREAAQDEREDADIEDLLEEPADDIVLAAHRPEQAGQRDVDADQDASSGSATSPPSSPNPLSM